MSKPSITVSTNATRMIILPVCRNCVIIHLLGFLAQPSGPFVMRPQHRRRAETVGNSIASVKERPIQGELKTLKNNRSDEKTQSS